VSAACCFIVHFRWAEIWPLAVIAAGLMMVWGSIESRRRRISSPDGKSTMNATSVFGGVERRITAQDFRYGGVSAVFGGIELDFHGAEIDGEEAALELNTCRASSSSSTKTIMWRWPRKAKAADHCQRGSWA
jgi:hypothetical protein